LRDGRVPDEPRFVERMLTNIETEIRGLEVKGLQWEAGTLSSYGKRASEPRYGADFLGVFEVNLPDYYLAKGFLAQAKLIRSGRKLGKAERGRLRVQCEKMLAVTPDAFAFVIRPNEVTIVPAVSVQAGDNEPLDLYQRGVRHFFEEHFASFIGDGLFSSANASALDQLPALQERYDVRHVIYVTARTDAEGVRARLDEFRRRRPQ
jgi:hypothetical protein